MGRPPKLNAARLTSVMLGEEHRAIIETQAGSEGVSGFIRDCIIMRSPVMSKSVLEQENKELKEQILVQDGIIEANRKQEAKRIKVSEEQLAYIGQSYQHWKNTTGLNNQQSRMGWAQGSTKGLKISAEEALAYLQAEGAFTL